MDSVRAFACSRTMWSRATGSSVAIRIRSFEERFSVTTITVGRSRAHKWRPRQHAYDWTVHTANVARSFGRYSNESLCATAFPNRRTCISSVRRLAARFSSYKLDPRELCVSEQNPGEAR